MSEVANPKSNTHVAAQQIVIELIRAGKINGTDPKFLAENVNKVYEKLVDGYNETHNR